jgi:release factor glutamine methyltransferase
MIIRQALVEGAEKLTTKSTSPELDSEVLLSFVLNQPKEYLAINSSEDITPENLSRFADLIQKRSEGWPAAYLTGHKGFYGLDFEVNQSVLIPRPATEEIVAEIIKQTEGQSNLKLLDIGTGSGCIIVSLAHTLGSDNQYFASDISEESLAVAQRNANKHNVVVTFKQSDLLSAWDDNFDILIANLPYGWKGWTNESSMDSVGLKFEPPHALFAENNGLGLIEKLLQQVASLDSPPSSIFLEFDPRQEEKLQLLTSQSLPQYEYTLYKDLSHQARFISLRLK